MCPPSVSSVLVQHGVSILATLQVIRRGDRRPFYAPARYVMEVKAENGDWDSAWGGEAQIHYRSDNGEPIPSRSVLMVDIVTAL